jgi:hypothetical protein
MLKLKCGILHFAALASVAANSDVKISKGARTLKVGSNFGKHGRVSWVFA